MTLNSLSLALLAAGVATSAIAADPPSSTLADGDTIILKSTIRDFKPLLADDVDGDKKLVGTARTKMKVNKDDKGNYFVVIKDQPCEVSTKKVTVASSVGQMLSNITVTESDCGLTPLVKEGHNYEVSSDAIQKAGYTRLGWIYGGLAIPYKYFRHDQSLEPGTTIGPFLGYRLGQVGWGVSVVGMFGVANISVKVKDGDKLLDRKFWGLSRGVGLMFDITKSETPFRAGVMWGRDSVGKNNVDTYPHDGKNWLALQLGWEFSR